MKNVHVVASTLASVSIEAAVLGFIRVVGLTSCARVEFVRRRRRRSSDDDGRAEPVHVLVQLGELSGRQALEGASLAPGTDADTSSHQPIEAPIVCLCRRGWVR